ncbi:hypothetical protein HDU76_006688 [Blyttiomyces sp. JEL0837]|nr:hypothetical protein HDU76_006688 [Blyttiomyces sp. JEL0837]
MPSIFGSSNSVAPQPPTQSTTVTIDSKRPDSVATDDNVVDSSTTPPSVPTVSTTTDQTTDHQTNNDLLAIPTNTHDRESTASNNNVEETSDSVEFQNPLVNAGTMAALETRSTNENTSGNIDINDSASAHHPDSYENGENGDQTSLGDQQKLQPIDTSDQSGNNPTSTAEAEITPVNAESTTTPDSTTAPPPDREYVQIQLIPYNEDPAAPPNPTIQLAERKFKEGMIIRIGRQVVKDGQPVPRPNGKPDNVDLDVWYNSKVVSRSHAEMWIKEGQVYIKDIGSSSGTFLNKMRLSPSGKESRPYPLRENDLLTFGVDYKGKNDPVFKAVNIKIGFFDSDWIKEKRKNANPARFRTALKALLQSSNPYGTASNTSPTDDDSENGSTDCCICINTIAPFQAIFIAPCSHCYHFKCVYQMLIQSSMFQCPICRQVANLAASVSTESLFGDESSKKILNAAIKKVKDSEGGDGEDTDEDVEKLPKEEVDRIGGGSGGGRASSSTNENPDAGISTATDQHGNVLVVVPVNSLSNSTTPVGSPSKSIFPLAGITGSSAAAASSSSAGGTSSGPGSSSNTPTLKMRWGAGSSSKAKSPTGASGLQSDEQGTGSPSNRSRTSSNTMKNLTDMFRRKGKDTGSGGGGNGSDSAGGAE